MDDNDPFLNLNSSGATNLLLGSNEIQESTIVSSGYSAEFGSLAGANVSYVTKSGGNNFHGNAVYYWNGSALNANDWFLNNAGDPKNFSNANQWAASIGGPIKKDKLFFFFNTEGLRVIIPVSTAVAFPSQAFQTATIANLENNAGFPATSATVKFCTTTPKARQMPCRAPDLCLKTRSDATASRAWDPGLRARRSFRRQITT
jgi:hypothetical protein